MRTTQEPDALGLRRIREHLHTLTLARLHIVFLSLFKPDILGEVREIHVAIRRVEAFLPRRQGHFSDGSFAPDEKRGALTGRTIRSGFPCAPPAPSPLVALRIISLACLRLAPLSVPIWPSWISARLNGWNVGEGGMVDINATPRKVKGRARVEGENRESDTESPRQQSICRPRKLLYPSRHQGTPSLKRLSRRPGPIVAQPP